MESALYGIYALVVFVSEILLVRCAHSFDFWYVSNSCVNTVRQHFPWSILYIFSLGAPDSYANETHFHRKGLHLVSFWNSKVSYCVTGLIKKKNGLTRLYVDGIFSVAKEASYFK